MLFTDPIYALFLPAAFLLYWLASRGGKAAQQSSLLVLNGAFYAFWDWRFLLLLLLSAGVNYGAGLKMSNARSSGKAIGWYVFALLYGLGTLALFKYFGFFEDGFLALSGLLGIHPDLPVVHIILPLGISFYTLQNLSYVLDLRRGRTEVCRDPLQFFCFATFFPTVVSGPIERSHNLLRQLGETRVFEESLAGSGLRQILWGLFKKIVVAGNLARVLDPLFDAPAGQSGIELLLGMALFAFQLYADFSGYSDMAIGTGKLLGFRLLKNFEHPFFATSIPAYWRRWHISLTSLLTDYVFTPIAIALRDRGKAGTVLAILCTYTAVGIWHAGKWTFLVFGLLHTLYFLKPVLSGTLGQREKKGQARTLLPNTSSAVKMLSVFLLVAFAMLAFRADSLTAAALYLKSIFLQAGAIPKDPAAYAMPGLAATVMMAVEWLQYQGRAVLPAATGLRWMAYGAVLWVIYLFGASQAFFIYARF